MEILNEMHLSFRLRNYYVVGHTGHRDVFQDDIDLIESRLKDKLKEIYTKVTDRPPLLLSGFASGADEIAIRVAAELGYKLFILTLDEEDESRLNTFLAERSNNFLGTCRINVKGKQSNYERLGNYIIDTVDELIAVWDGVNTGKDGGTGQIVRKTINRQKGGIPLVIHQLVTPRLSNPFAIKYPRLATDLKFNEIPDYKWYSMQPPKSNVNKGNLLLTTWNRYGGLTNQFLIPVLLLLATVILGSIGFHKLDDCLEQNGVSNTYSSWDYFYRAVNLATLNTSVFQAKEECIPLSLELARGIGLLFLVYAFLLALLNLTGSNIHRIWIWYWITKYQIQIVWTKKSDEGRDEGPFDIIIGLSEASYYLALDLLKYGNHVIIVDRDSSNQYKVNCLEQGALFFPTRPTLPHLLKRISAIKAGHIYIFDEDDTQNARVLQQLDQFLCPLKDEEHKPNVFVHVNDVQTRYFLDNTTRFSVQSFNTYENIVRQLVQDFPLDRQHSTVYRKLDVVINTVQVAIIGFNDLSKSLLLHIASVGHYGDDYILSIRIYHYPEDAEEVAIFKKQYPCFDNAGTAPDSEYYGIKQEVFLKGKQDRLVEFEEIPFAESELLHGMFSLYSLIKKERIVTIYNCIKNGVRGTALLKDILPMLNQQAVRASCNLQVFSFYNISDLDELMLIEEKLNKDAPNIPVYCFGNFIEACTAASIHHDVTDLFARRINLWYDLLYSRNKTLAEAKAYWNMHPITDLDKEAAKLWADLTESMRDSNRAAADHVEVKLRIAAVNAGSNRSQIAIQLSSLQNLLARIEHQRWCAQKLIEGFLPLQDEVNAAELLDDWNQNKRAVQTLKFHLNLIPFDRLGEEKNKDDTQIIGIPYYLDANANSNTY